MSDLQSVNSLGMAANSPAGKKDTFFRGKDRE
jgi:hypothetical protein